MAVVEKTGFCTLCRSRCGTINLVENDRLVGVKPNPAHPTGMALCPKGRAAPEIAHSARRIRTPLRRTAPKGAADPAFEPISWDEALDEIGQRLNRYRAESGPESVAFAVTSGSSSSTSDGLDWIQRFIRSFGSPNNCFSTEICNWHKDNAHAFTFGCGLPVADYRNADLILLWGHNPTNVWLAQADAIGAARARGARLVVIDPRQTGSARDADLWLRVRPGTDGALAMGVARQLIEDQGHDLDFVEHWTNAALLVREDNGRFLRGEDLGWEDGAAYVVWDAQSGVPVPAAGAKPELRPDAHTLPGRDGTLSCRTAWDHYVAALAPFDPDTVEGITGVPATQIRAFAQELARAGSVCYHGWTGLGQHSNASQTERAIATLYALTGSFDAPGGNLRMAAPPTPVLHSMAMIPPETRAKTLGLAERPVGPPTDGWINSTDLYDAILEAKPYQVRALMAFGSNLMVSHPDPARSRAALAALEFQVHCDLFLNPTANMADIVLPVSSPWEHEALRIGFEISRQAQELVQLRQQIIPRQGEAHSDTWIVFQLATRLGLNEAFFDGDMDAAYEHVLAPMGLDLATLRAHPEGVRVPLEQRFRKYRDTGFATQTGRAELYSELLWRHGYPPVPQFVAPAEQANADFPLTLFSVNNGYFCHSQQRGINTLRKRRPDPLAEMHPATAGRHGIEAGDWMEVETARGAIKVRATVNEALALDTLACDYGWWQAAPDLGLLGQAPDATTDNRNFNSLFSGDIRDPLSGSLPLRSSRCRVSKLQAGPWRGWRSFIVAERRQESAGGVGLTLEATDGLPLASFLPGQYVGLRIGGDTRSYSLTGLACAQPDAYRITVQRLEGGLVSQHIADRLQPGHTLELQAPIGGFVMPLRNEFPVVLIAGGIGITPFMSYLETLTGDPAEPEVHLHYACRDAANQPFATRLAELAARLPKLSITTYLSRPESDAQCSARRRFTLADIAPETIAARARFYLCASDAMLREVSEGLLARGVPAFEIFSERFISPANATQDELAPRTLHFLRSDRKLVWQPSDGSLLSCAEAAGISLPSGCRVGQCESCALDVVSGSVRHLVDTPDLETGRCLTCQAVPLSDLVLDV
jgi:anaerobic selenocysteine-containing dehydrogenase/ferredoxin-NADP reductase